MDEQQIKTPFDLVEKVVANEKVMARPVEWSAEITDGEGHAADGECPTPTRFETACPKCGQMVAFAATLESVKCSECGTGVDREIMFVKPIESPFADPAAYAPEKSDVEVVKVGTSEEIAKSIEDVVRSLIAEAGLEEPAVVDGLQEETDTELDAAAEAEMNSIIEEMERESGG